MRTERGSGSSAETTGRRTYVSPAASLTAICRRLVARELSRVADLPVRVRLWDGTVIANEDIDPVATVNVRTRTALLGLLLGGEFRFAELYSTGDVEIEGDLVALLERVNRSAPRTRSLPAAIVERCRRHRWLVPAVSARSNARHHYDVGNDFYRIWLDPTMTYSCAYFAEAGMTLRDAQLAKLDLVCAKLRLRPGERVIEAGSGWGSLAIRAAEKYGVTVRAYNVSAAQTAYAREQAALRGLSGKVEFIEDDFRAITGSCDAFVSVGMLEHVGRRHYAELGAVIAKVLAPSGRGLIHSIGRHREVPTSRWIDRRIFPGGYAPTLREMLEVFEPNDLVVWDVENLRPHYAQTLACWLAAYDRSAQRIAELYGDVVARRWRLYLASSEASFRAGWHELFQVVFTRPAYTGFPRARTSNERW